MNLVAFANADNYRESTVREALKLLFRQLGYPEQNPLSALIKPGDTVFIKPNWVAHQYRKSAPRQDSLYSTITHPNVIKVVADYVAEALQGKGEIKIGDNPSIDADFDILIKKSGLRKLEKAYDVPCTLLDLRPMRCTNLEHYGKKHLMASQAGDPLGRTTVNLGKRSLLYGVNSRLFRGVFTDRRETQARHRGEVNEYEFSTSIVAADVYISLPKMKTHHKVGTTLNLKGLVGSVANKNLLVHWRIGWPAIGGDEYPSFAAWVRAFFAKVKHRGAWSGNDTIWRMVVDLYNAFVQIGPKRTLSIVDGIIGGEGDGPFYPTSKQAKVLIGGESLLAVDLVTSRLMGFDIGAIPYLQHYLSERQIRLEDIRVMHGQAEEKIFSADAPFYGFRPPTNWAQLPVARSRGE